jgi:hypothetical protein
MPSTEQAAAAELTIDQWFAREDSAVQAIFAAMPKRRKPKGLGKPRKTKAEATDEPWLRMTPLQMRCLYLREETRLTLQGLDKIIAAQQFPRMEES